MIKVDDYKIEKTRGVFIPIPRPWFWPVAVIKDDY
jgi:hypothetical protein